MIGEYENRESFLDLKVSIINNLKNINPSNEGDIRVRDLDRRRMYDWIIPHLGEPITYCTRLMSKTPPQAFKELFFMRPDIIDKKNRDKFTIYVALYKNGGEN